MHFYYKQNFVTLVATRAREGSNSKLKNDFQSVCSEQSTAHLPSFDIIYTSNHHISELNSHSKEPQKM